MGLLKLIRDDSKQVPIYVVQGKFYSKSGESLSVYGEIPEEYQKWGFKPCDFVGFLAEELERDLGK